MKAILFPGQGAQFEGMGKDLYDQNETAKRMFDQANEILGFSITDVMFTGSAAELVQTKITQPAIFLHSVITAAVKLDESASIDAVAGHSLGEFSALVACGALAFEDALQLVSQRALAMQQSCEEVEGTMAAIMARDMKAVEDACAAAEGIVVPANYNTPNQLVISGSIEGVKNASAKLDEMGCRVVPLQVGGAFHSPLMASAKDQLEKAILSTQFSTPSCPIYQNVTAQATQDVDVIRQNLIDQLTGSVRWSQSIKQMIADGFTSFTEVGGKGNILLGMLRKIDRRVEMNVL